MPEPVLPIIRPVMDEREVAAARRPILSGWVTQGPEVAAFESEFAEAVGARYACAVANCTAALHMALRVVGVGPEDEVVTVGFSYIATANCIRYCGAIPVFVDIEPATYNIDAGRLEASLTQRTRAILCVHQLGMPCDLAAIVAIAERHSLPLIEDAACASGSQIRWKGTWQPIGAPHGDVACFSFHPRKVITTGDGGMLTTSDPGHAEHFRLWRQHGMTVPDTVRHVAREVIIESYSEVGYNYRMTDIQAAVGREQLRRLPVILEERRSLAARYTELLEGTPRLRPPVQPEWARSNWQAYCVRLPAGCDQRGVMQLLLDRGIATRRGSMCAHREPAYAGEPWKAGAGGLAESERAQDETILLPLFHGMTDMDQMRVVEALRLAVRTNDAAG
jgi:perosamine synthetase